MKLPWIGRGSREETLLRLGRPRTSAGRWTSLGRYAMAPRTARPTRYVAVAAPIPTRIISRSSFINLKMWERIFSSEPARSTRVRLALTNHC